MVLYLDRMCQRGLLMVRWSHIGTLMRRLAAEPCSTAELLFLSQCLSGMILHTDCARSHIQVCGTGGFHEQGQCFLIGLSCSIPTLVFYYFALFLLSLSNLVLWGWGLRTDRVYITCLSLALPTFFNNNKNNNGMMVEE